VELARRHEDHSGQEHPTPEVSTSPVVSDPIKALDANLTASPTEQRNPRSMQLDKLSVRKAIELMASG
jgi:hypothetical protein